MTWASALLGATLCTKGPDGSSVTKSTEEVLANKKFVALYFSAHWCGPCRKFTPLFAVTYDDQVDKNEVEVVFVSLDNDTESFEEYYAEQPWTAVPYASAERETVADKFGVQGIPHVVVLSGADGSVVSSDARKLITDKKTLSGIF